MLETAPTRPSPSPRGNPSSATVASNFFTEDLLPDLVLAVGARGIIVHSITPEASARTRLEEGMIITSINDAPTLAMADVATHLRKGVNKITVLVGEATRTLSVRIP